ncbi:MAG: D-fructose-6-phosphate amidotransferase [SAR202 cluster bacterium Io17-Chloro-G4]|nr:MAG: D-fructose-6-phosphate amidotransferase [SAR202 cluster bacterium Io17-Chloro-G4]
MAAYVIVDIEVTNAEDYAKYRELAPPMVAKYGGKYLARGGEIEVLEGDWAPKRLVILEFPSFERAKEFFEAEEYQPVRQVRINATKSKAVLLDGV